jgi:hypothetical protein
MSRVKCRNRVEGRNLRYNRHSLVLNDTDCLLEAGRLISSVSEAALTPGGLLDLFNQPARGHGGGPGVDSIEALSLESRTEWFRGRLSRSLIFEVTQRVQEDEEEDVTVVSGQLQLTSDCPHNGSGGDRCSSGAEVIGDLLDELVETAAAEAEARHRRQMVRSLLASSVPEFLLDKDEVQEVGDI